MMGGRVGGGENDDGSVVLRLNSDQQQDRGDEGVGDTLVPGRLRRYNEHRTANITFAAEPGPSGWR